MVAADCEWTLRMRWWVVDVLQFIRIDLSEDHDTVPELISQKVKLRSVTYYRRIIENTFFQSLVACISWRFRFTHSKP